MDFLANSDLRNKGREEKMFYQRVKAILTGNTGDFPTQIEGLVALDELNNKGYARKSVFERQLYILLKKNSSA